MSETPAHYGTHPAEREADALQDVLTRREEERADACAELERAALDLRAWVRCCRKLLQTNPAAPMNSLWAMLDRESLSGERKALDAAGVTLERLQTLDPTAARKAYAKTIKSTKQAGELRCLKDAAGMLADAMKAGNATERDRLRSEALGELTRAKNTGGLSLNDAWEAYRADRFTRGEAGPDEVLRLDSNRGPWADWMNAWNGTRNGLEPGRCVIIGARPGAGKTSMTTAWAVDAMAAGCPVLFWQLELSREETLEHLLAQVPGTGRWWNDYWTKRCNKPIPEAWEPLLDLPPVNGPEEYEAETIRDAMLALAARRRSRHKCKGLVIVDYAQLLTIRDRRGSTPQHEILTKAASMLAKTAGDHGLCLLLLSQLTKAAKNAQHEGKGMEETALTGADLSRMAHVAFGLSHAVKNGAGDWIECGARDVEKGPNGEGEARLLANLKRRGFSKIADQMPDFTKPLWASDERALHGGEIVSAEKGGLEW